MNKTYCLIWIKKEDKNIETFARKLENWLLQRQVTPLLASDAQSYFKLQTTPDLIVSLGGDGTLLGLGRVVAGQNIPIIGINLGHVGFLCAADLSNWEDVLSRALKHLLSPVRCLALRWQLFREAAPGASGTAVNELAITHGFFARMLDLSIIVDDMDLGILRGDGLICYTPLGSSGYNLSARGSIMAISLNSIGLTPICPFNASFAPLILNGNAKITISTHECVSEVCVTIDGQEGVILKKGDEIRIEAMQNALNLPGLRNITKANLCWRSI